MVANGNNNKKMDEQKGLPFFCCELCNCKYRVLERLYKHYADKHNGAVPKEEPKEKNISKKLKPSAPRRTGPVAEECSICLMGIVERGCAVPCGHTKFCLECLKKCGETCPICRTKIDNKIKVF